MKAEGRFEALATMGLAPIEPLNKTSPSKEKNGPGGLVPAEP